MLIPIPIFEVYTKNDLDLQNFGPYVPLHGTIWNPYLFWLPLVNRLNGLKLNGLKLNGLKVEGIITLFYWLRVIIALAFNLFSGIILLHVR